MIINLNKKNLWLTSDLHLFHSNIIKYCNRPYPNCFSMNKDIIDTINKNIHQDDLLINLGDIGFNSVKYITDELSKINCNQIFVSGNHDRKSLINALIEKYIVFEKQTILDVYFNDIHYKVHLAHNPDDIQYNDEKNNIFLYGHLHDKEVKNKRFNQMNIGWDQFGRPIELKEIINIIKQNKKMQL